MGAPSSTASLGAVSKFLKWALVGGVIGAGAAAADAYKRDRPVNELVKNVAIGGGAGVALGSLTFVLGSKAGGGRGTRTKVAEVADAAREQVRRAERLTRAERKAAKRAVDRATAHAEHAGRAARRQAQHAAAEARAAVAHAEHAGRAARRQARQAAAEARAAVEQATAEFRTRLERIAA